MVVEECYRGLKDFADVKGRKVIAIIQICGLCASQDFESSSPQMFGDYIKADEAAAGWVPRHGAGTLHRRGPYSNGRRPRRVRARHCRKGLAKPYEMIASSSMLLEWLAATVVYTRWPLPAAERST